MANRAIRQLEQKDKAPLMKIIGALQEFKPFEVTVAEELIDEYLVNSTASGYNIFVAEIDSRIAGYICYGPTPLTEGTWDIYWMAVDRDQQGQGVGAMLLTYAEGEIIKEHGRLIMIETSSTTLYDKTRRFYLGRGYEAVCTIEDFYAPGDGKVIYKKVL